MGSSAGRPDRVVTEMPDITYLGRRPRHRLRLAVLTELRLLANRAQPQVRMVLERLEDRPLGLGQRARRGVRRVGEREPKRADEEVVRLLAERERARLARRADDAAGGAGEADEVLGLPAARAGGQLWREAGREQQLEPERERVRARRARGVGVEQRQLVGEQVVDAAVRLTVVEQPRYRVAGARGAVERRAVLPQPRVAVQRLRARYREQLAAALVEHQPEPEVRLQPAAEARLHPPHALRDR